ASPRPLSRLQALCTLDGLGTLPNDLLVVTLGDNDPGVRRQAVRLSEPRLNSSRPLREALHKLPGDKDPPAGMQAADPPGAAADALVGILLLTNAADPYITAAALSSVQKQNIREVLELTLSDAAKDGDSAKLVERLLTMAAAMGEDAAVGK